MKIIITEDQKKKLFIPRKIDERDRQFLSEIGMDPVLQYMIDNKTEIQFDMSTLPDEWRWDVNGIFDTSDYSKPLYHQYEKPIKDLILNMLEEQEDGIFHVWGYISITEENELFINFDYEITIMKTGSKTYKL